MKYPCGVIVRDGHNYVGRIGVDTRLIVGGLGGKSYHVQIGQNVCVTGQP